MCKKHDDEIVLMAEKNREIESLKLELQCFKSQFNGIHGAQFNANTVKSKFELWLKEHQEYPKLHYNNRDDQYLFAPTDMMYRAFKAGKCGLA